MMMRTLLTVVLGVALAGSGPLGAAGLDRFKTADDLWAQIEQLAKGPTDHPKSREDVPRVYAAYFDEFDAALTAFGERYPADPRRWEARLHQLRIGAMRAGLKGQEPDLAVLKQGLQEVSEAKDATAVTRQEARFGWLQVRAQLPAETGTAAGRSALDTDLEAFRKENASDPRSVMLRFAQVDLWETAEPARAEKILQELAASETDEVAAAAKKRLGLLALKRTPVALKFTALDGSAFDLAQWRGKVVLIDFWATWCGPCLQDLPNVVAAYDKLHPKGFEIVGISLDKDKAKLQGLVQAKGMKWPQYFDGKGWENAISRRFGVEQIPTQWLVDKKGLVRMTEARGNLAAEIEKLLAE